MRRALLRHDPDAELSLAGSPQELRQWAQETVRPPCVVVGPLATMPSSINVAAAVVRDGRARTVVLVDREPDDDLVRRARRAGIACVLVASRSRDLDDLDEPDLESDVVPTMLLAPRPEPRADLRAVPRVEMPPPALQASAEEVELAPEPVSEGKRATADVAHAPVTGNAPVLALFSGRGGVGKTTLAAAMAHVAASWGMRVALCDLDLSFGNLYSFLGLSGPADLSFIGEDAHRNAADILAAGQAVRENVALWGPCARPESAELVAPGVRELLDVLAREHDLVIVDTPTACTDVTAQAARLCDRMLLTVDARPGMAAAQARLGALAVRLGVARTRIVRVANRCGQRGRAMPDINRADLGLETARTLRVVDGGAEVSDCMAQGEVGELFEFGSRFSQSVAHALAQLLAELGALPEDAEAKRARDWKEPHARFSFGRRKEAV